MTRPRASGLVQSVHDRLAPVDLDADGVRKLLGAEIETFNSNDRFRRFIDESGLPLRAHAEFQKADLDTRQVLYQRLAERIWSLKRLAHEASS